MSAPYTTNRPALVYGSDLIHDRPAGANWGRCGAAISAARVHAPDLPVPITCPGCREQIDRAARVRKAFHRLTWTGPSGTVWPL